MKLYKIDAWEYMSSLPDNAVQAVITDPDYYAEIDMEEIRRVCSGNIVMFCTPGKTWFEPDEVAEWIKPTSTKNYSRHLARYVEWILIERHGGIYNSNLFWANYTGIYHDILLEKPTHPHQKPLSLMQRLIAIYTNPGDVVLDPFAGSGTTLKAADSLSRKGIGCEINL